MVRSFDHSIVRRSFIVPIHRSSFVHTNYSPSLFTVTFTVTIYRYFLPLLFTVTIHRYFLPLLFTVTIYRYFLPLLFTVTFYRYLFTVTFLPLPFYCYFLPLLFTITFYRYYLPLFFTVTIYRYYSSLLFIDHPITSNFNYSSIMLSSPPKTSQTHIPVILTPVTVIFLPVGTFHLVTHPRFLQVEHA
jgi:hypothetical protein